MDLKNLPLITLYDVKHKYVTTSNIDKLDNIIKIKNKKLFLKVDVESHEYFF